MALVFCLQNTYHRRELMMESVTVVMAQMNIQAFILANLAEMSANMVH